MRCAGVPCVPVPLFQAFIFSMYFSLPFFSGGGKIFEENIRFLIFSESALVLLFFPGNCKSNLIEEIIFSNEKAILKKDWFGFLFQNKIKSCFLILQKKSI